MSGQGRCVIADFVKYDPKLKKRAQHLRKHSTLSEVLLWRELKGKKLLGYDFHRQKPIGHYWTVNPKSIHLFRLKIFNRSIYDKVKRVVIHSLAISPKNE